MPNDNTINRRTAIIGLPLALVGAAATVKSYRDFTPTPAHTTAPGVLDERGLSYALELLTEASTSGISCSFTAFAHHLSTLATAGDCQQIRAVAEKLIDRLYAQHNH
jgi:hypothetical protein